MSFLSALGGDIKKVFGWVASPKGQAVVSAVEIGVEDAFPAATGIVNLLNTWGAEIFKSQAMAEAAGQGQAGALKAASVLNVLTPEVLSFAKAQGIAVPSAAHIQQINDQLVNIINILSGVATPAPAPPIPQAPAPTT